MSQPANQMGTVQRPGNVTAAAVILIVLGSLGALLGLLYAVVGQQLTGLGGLAGTAGGVVMVMAALILAFSVLEIVSGAKILKLRPGGGRVMGIVLSIIGAVFMLFGLLGSFTGGESTIDPNTFEITQGGFSVGGFLISLILLVLYVAVAWILIKARPVFTGTAQGAPPPPPPPPPA